MLLNGIVFLNSFLVRSENVVKFLPLSYIGDNQPLGLPFRSLGKAFPFASNIRSPTNLIAGPEFVITLIGEHKKPRTPTHFEEELFIVPTATNCWNFQIEYEVDYEICNTFFKMLNNYI